MEVDEGCNSEQISDSSDEEDCDECIMDAKNSTKIAELEEKIEENSYDYNSHVELITILRNLAELEKLRGARNRMASYFPLTSTLWMEWLTDEIKIATTKEEKCEVVEIFEKAVKDYLSVDVWLEYVQFSIGLHGDKEEAGVEEIRNVFERALAAAGLHVVKGALLWEAYFEYELMVLTLALSSKTTSKESVENQRKRIANLFRRQLSCPLLDMDETLEKFNLWLVESTGDCDSRLIDKKMVQYVFNTSKQKLAIIEKFEEKILKDDENFENYTEYLEHEKSKEGSPGRVLVLYERALSTSLCLHENIWLEYVEYIDTILHDGPSALNVLKRALRNCPWSSKLAVMQIRLLEKYQGAHEEVLAAVEQALSTGLQQPIDFRDVWLAFLEYARRRSDAPGISKDEEDKRLEELRASFQKAADYINGVEGADPECTILQFWARVEAKAIKDLEKARILWNDILSIPSNRTAAMWQEYINLENAYGDSKHLKKLFPRALQQVTDWPESICNAWLNYERDEGTLESYTNCVNKCQARIKQFREKREKEQYQSRGPEKSQNQWDDSRKPKRGGLGFKAKEKNNETARLDAAKTRKRRMDDVPANEVSPEKKKRLDSSNGSAKDLVDNLLKEKEHGAVVKHDPSKDNRTLFISNLDYSTSEEAIREAFSPDGQITDLRLVKDFKGRFKGYCYVEFDKIESAMKGLKRDRQLIGGRPMFVSKCDPDKETRTGGLRFSTHMEKNKLFVRGLPISTSVDDLRQLFGQFGTLKDVRLVTYRNGHSKGLAYVDFEDEVSATQAILKTDGTTVGDKIISVAISNPPSRLKPEPTGQSAPIASLGGGSKDFGARGKSRTQISFLPRSVQLNSAATKAIENLSIKSPNPASSTTSTS